MATKTEYRVRKTLLGSRIVEHTCNACGGDLQSPLDDAGTVQQCPRCNRSFLTPGEKELKELKREAAAREQKAADEAAQKRRLAEANNKAPSELPTPRVPEQKALPKSAGLKWIVRGANPETGSEISREIEAATAAEAESFANARGMLVESISPERPECENCGRKFGKLETPIQHGGHVICVDCLPRIGPPAALFARTTSTVGGLQYESTATDQRPVAMAVESIQMLPCVGCGSRIAPVRKAKGSTAVLVILIVFLLPIGIIYLLLNSGYQLVCPTCGIKRGDVG